MASTRSDFSAATPTEWVSETAAVASSAVVIDSAVFMDLPPSLQQDFNDRGTFVPVRQALSVGSEKGRLVASGPFRRGGPFPRADPLVPGGRRRISVGLRPRAMLVAIRTCVPQADVGSGLSLSLVGL
jgi:hypothetical protein